MLAFMAIFQFFIFCIFYILHKLKLVARSAHRSPAHAFLGSVFVADALIRKCELRWSSAAPFPRVALLSHFSQRSCPAFHRACYIQCCTSCCVDRGPPPHGPHTKYTKTNKKHTRYTNYKYCHTSQRKTLVIFNLFFFEEYRFLKVSNNLGFVECIFTLLMYRVL